MTLLRLAIRNLLSKPVSAILSLLLLVLSVALVTFVLQVNSQVGTTFDKNIKPVDMVVGAKGSPLQLVLSAILHLDVPTGNISLNDAKALAKNPLVSQAVSISYGDNHKGYRILGTDTTYLGLYKASVRKGLLFKNSFEVVLGQHVHKALGLDIGDWFVGSHGLAANASETHQEHPFIVTGILNETGTVVDHLIITPLESVWEVHEHDHADHADHEIQNSVPDRFEDEVVPGSADRHEYQDREITALLIKFRNPLGMVQFPRFVNENTDMQAALPSYEIQKLMGLLGSGVKTLSGIALAILLVSGLSIFLGLIKAIRERRQELALMRTYGASTLNLLMTVLYEGISLAFFGFILGWLIGRIGLWAFSAFARNSYGYTLYLTMPTRTEGLLLLCVIALAVLAVIFSATSLFKLNISKTLTNG